MLDLEWLQSSWEAYWAYLAPWISPLSAQGVYARPSSGWHVTRMALARCAKAATTTAPRPRSTRSSSSTGPSASLGR